MLVAVICYLVSTVRPILANTPSSNISGIAWNIADVRVVDYVDASEPFLDLIAAYTREQGDVLQLRLDYLDISLNEPQNIVIAIDNKPGGNSLIPLSGDLSLFAEVELDWDLLFLIDNNRDFIALDQNLNVMDSVQGRVERDLAMDMVIISIDSEVVISDSNPVNAQVFSLPVDMDGIADSTAVFSLDQVAGERAKVALFFWNTFQSRTPAEALRSWDGAHAGPLSNRHGLRYLIEAVSAIRVPVVLADLATLSNLSALDYLGVISMVRGLVRDRVLFFGLCCLDYEFCLAGNGYTHFSDNFSKDITPGAIPEIALSLRQSFVASAHSDGTIVIIGGDFATSEWGIPSVAQYGLEYIVNHPWIQVTGEVGSLPGSATITAHCDFHQAPDVPAANVHLHLAASPPNPLTETAWQMYRMLISDKLQEEMAQIIYSHIFHVLAAAQWAESPYEKTDCEVDLDQNGDKECILANRHIFTTIEPKTGTMIFAFFKDAASVHQFIGPTHQFSASNSLSQIPDALSGTSVDVYQVNVLSPGVIELISGKLAMRKLFVLSTSSIAFSVEGTQSTIYMPLAVDPWQRFKSNWGENYYANFISPQSQVWGLHSGIAIEITSPNPNSLIAFNASIETIRQPENPNHDYTAGHYLPFPMALVALQPTDGSASVAIQIIP